MLQPFEPELDWSAFSVPVAEKDIPVLHEKLAEVEARPGAVTSLQQTLHCAAQHMIYSSITGGFLGEQGVAQLHRASKGLLSMLRRPCSNAMKAHRIHCLFLRCLRQVRCL